MAIAGAPLECDVFCSYLMGFDPAGVGYLHYLNAPSLDEIEVSGSEISRKMFKPHPRIELQMKWKE
jgi:hypothetical protein